MPGHGGPAADGLDAVIAALEVRLRTETDFGRACDFFHDAVVGHPALIPSSEPGVHEVLSQSIDSMLNQKVGVRMVGEAEVFHVPSARFWHGHVECEEGMAIFFYFDETGMGLLSYARSLSDPAVAHMRFSTTTLSGKVAFPMRGAPSKA